MYPNRWEQNEYYYIWLSDIWISSCFGSRFCSWVSALPISWFVIRFQVVFIVLIISVEVDSESLTMFACCLLDREREDREWGRSWQYAIWIQWGSCYLRQIDWVLRHSLHYLIYFVRNSLWYILVTCTQAFICSLNTWPFCTITNVKNCFVT